MKKLSITIDLLKINKDKIEVRTYTNKDGLKITQKNYKLDIVPLREKKIIKEGNDWKMIKTHFVSEAQTKEEKDKQEKAVIIGDGIVFQTPAEVAEDAMKEQVWEDHLIKQRNPNYPTPSEQGITFKTPTAEDLDINPDDIPF